MKRIMGIDYGDARTGVAMSDLLCSIVGSTVVVPSRNRDKAIADIVRLAKEQEVGKIVVGLPRNMDGTGGLRAQLCREFANLLGEATGLEIVMSVAHLPTSCKRAAIPMARYQRERLW